MFYIFIVNRNHAIYVVPVLGLILYITLLAAVDYWLCVFICLCASVFSR